MNIEQYQQPYIDRQIIQHSYADWMSTFNTKYHLTLSFTHGASEETTRLLLNRTLVHLNKGIFKRRYRDGKSYIKGFAVREETPAMDTNHFHLLMFDDWLPAPKRMIKEVEKQIAYVNRTSGRDKVQNHLLQTYYNHGGNDLELYVVKQFNDKSKAIDWVGDSVGLLTLDNVEFGRLKFNEQPF